MNVIGINGGPRKSWNTAAMIDEALRGAQSKGAQTERIDLYDLDFKGCVSCFSCKRKGGDSYGRCALEDGLAPVLQKIWNADAVVFGSPIYFGNVTGEMRSFLERLLFPYSVYDKKHSTLFPKKIRSVFIYTMNVKREVMVANGYLQNLGGMENAVAREFGPIKTFYCNDTYQFDDYSKYESSAFDEPEKAKTRKEVFPFDLKRAFELGKWCVEAEK